MLPKITIMADTTTQALEDAHVEVRMDPVIVTAIDQMESLLEIIKMPAILSNEFVELAYSACAAAYMKSQRHPERTVRRDN
jgi:hypothetical protein